MFFKINENNLNSKRKIIYADIINFSNDIKTEKFKSIMEIAIELNDKNNYKEGGINPLYWLIKTIGSEIQYSYFNKLLKNRNPEIKLPEITFDLLFFNTLIKVSDDNKDFSDICLKKDRKQIVDFSKDLVLSSPWNKERFRDSLFKIGENRPRGMWQEDKMNHNSSYYYPLNLTIAYNGLHSISTGIIQSYGKMECTQYYDLSLIYKYVWTDGKNYYRKNNNSVIEKVWNIEFAAIFEIGRLIKDRE